MGSRTPFTPDDISNLASYLLTLPSQDHSKPSTFREGVLSGKLPNHSEQSWLSHYKNNKEFIQKQIEKFKRDRDREWDNNKKEKKGKGKEKAKDQNEGQDEEEKEGEEVIGSESGEPSSSSSSKKKKKEKKRGKSRSSKSYSPLVSTTTERKKKVPFTDQDWERLIKMLAKAKEREWNKGRIYQELEEKYPDHTRQSWQTYHSKSREDADGALKMYLKDLRKHNETVETTCDEEEEEVEEPPRKKKKNNNNDVRETEKKKPSTTSSSNSTNKVIVDDEFDSPSPSPSKSPPFKSLPKRPQPSTSTSSTSCKPKPQPQPQPHPQRSKSSSKALPPQTQQQQRIIEISSSDENNSAQSPPSRHCRRPPPPPPAPPAPFPPIESFNPSFPTTSTSATNSKVQKEEKQQQEREQQLELAKTIPLPEPEPDENENQDYSIVLEDEFKNDDDDNDHDEPSTQEEEDDFRDRDLEKRKGTRKEEDPSPSPSSDEDEDDQEEEEEEDSQDDDELKDDHRLIWELTRIDWFDSTKQMGYENLSKLYPHYSSEEWEKVYKSKLSYFLPLISKSLEALEEEERDSEEEEMEENYLLEELVRCELLGIEKNPQVWENLNKLYPRLNQLEWKELYNKTKRSVWQKRIGEKIKLAEEDRERRRRKKEGKEKKKGKGIERVQIQKVVRETKENKRKVEEEGEGETSSRGKQKKRVDKGKGRAVDQDQGIQTEAATVRGSDVISRPPSATAARPSSTQNRPNPTKALKSVAHDPNSSNNRSTSRYRDTLKPTPTPPPRDVPPVTVPSASKPPVTTTTQPQPQPVSSHRSPSPPSPPRRPRILSAKLEPPTPERQRSPHSAVPRPSSSPHRPKLVPPTTPDMPTPPPLLPPSSSSSTDETVLHWSQYSILPSPLKQSLQSRLLNSSYDDREDDEEDEGEREHEDVEMKEEREIELKIEAEKKEKRTIIIPSRTSTSEETTSSDRILLAKMERSVLEEEQEEAEEEVMEEDISEEEEDKLVEQQLLSQPQPQLHKYELDEDNQEEVQLPRHSVEEIEAPGTTSVSEEEEEEDEDGLDLSHPFENFDPSEPIFAPLTSEEEAIGLDHIKVLERWESRRASGEETENEEGGGEGEENNLGASALQREAEEWARDDQKERQRRMVPQGEEVEANEAESEVGLEKFGREEEEKENDRIDKSIGGGGKKRRRSEVSGSFADVEQPPTKKPRQKSLQSTVSAVSSSMTPEDVENWRDRVQQEKVTSSPLDQPRPPVVKSGSIAFEPRPLGSPRRTPRASIAASSPRIKVAQLPSTSSRPSATAPPPATHRNVDQTASKNVRKDLEKIAQDLDLDINFVDGLYFRCCAPSNLDLFRNIAKMHSPKLRPDPSTSEYQKLEKKIKLWLWDYEEDKILLEGTKEEKAQLEKKKSKKAVTRRLEFFKRSKKNKIEQLPPRYYPSLSHAK